jgi:hypothetical protein
MLASKPTPAFTRYIGIDYSGAETPKGGSISFDGPARGDAGSQ